VHITHFDELGGVADGQRVEVQGRYERWNPDLAPPGSVPLSARVVLVGGGGVLIGRYADAECRRADDELATLAGAIVRVSGTYFNGRAFPGPGPPPGLWTGGGSQIVDVGRVELIEAAKPIVPPPVPPVPEPPLAPTAVTADVEFSPPVASTIPSNIGLLARASLSDGVSRIGAVASLLALLATSAGLFVAHQALGSPFGRRFASAGIVIGGMLGYWVVDRAISRIIATRELRWLASLPWTFDLPSYVAQLNEESMERALRIDVELVAPIGIANRSSVFDARGLGRATVEWTGDRFLSIQCPTVKTEWVPPGPAFGLPSYSNGRVHRWFRRCVKRALLPLYGACRVRSVRVRMG
jgi:hypothetical protein